MSRPNAKALEIGFATVWPPWFGLKNTIRHAREGAIRQDWPQMLGLTA
jgi:hypothetical protein